MKTIWLAIYMALTGGLAQAQTVSAPPPQTQNAPINTPYQLPTYYQGNESYSNNSMQNNKPPTPNAGPYTGNGNYVDPTRNAPAPAIINYNTNQLPAPAPLNNPVNTNSSNTTIDKR